ncbi:hypothetical protein GC207_12050 [bacterium]|nr:hypothetical protein [bacterium]
MKLTKISLLLALTLGATVPVVADDASDLDKQVEQIDRTEKEAHEAKPSPEALNDLAKRTHVPVRKLEEQHDKTKMGTGSLYIANVLAEKSGKSFDEIVAAKKAGAGWGKIAKDNGVKLGPLVSEAKKLEKQTRARHENTRGHNTEHGSQNQHGDADKKSDSHGGKGGGKGRR